MVSFPSFNSARLAQIRETEIRQAKDRARVSRMVPVMDAPFHGLPGGRVDRPFYGFIPCHGGGFIPALKSGNFIYAAMENGFPVRFQSARKAIRKAASLRV